MKKLMLILLLLLTLGIPGKASHFMGGEIWWECLSNGQYKFYARLYQECAGINYIDTLELMTNTALGSITLINTEINDITPQCYNNPTFPHIDCDSIHIYNTPNHGGIMEWVYESDPINLLASGPPATGWVFSINIEKRNNATNIISNSSYNGYLKAVMYPQPGISDYSNCWDNSPHFLEAPLSAICTAYPFEYGLSVIDKELDSLVYDWAEPLDWDETNNPPVPITNYAPGYSYQSPLPGPLQNPLNIPATINPGTGEISFTSYTSGAFVTAFKVSSYKCGVKTAEIYRDFQVVLLACGVNNPPAVFIQYPNGDTLNSFVDTVFAGTLVKLNIWSFDGEMLNDTFTPQTITFNAAGLELGLDGISITTGCLIPPCAQIFGGDTINPLPLPVMGQWAVNTSFRWQTDILHLDSVYSSCGDVSRSFDFFLWAKDDYCPVPGRTSSILRIVVKYPALPSPLMNNYFINGANNQVTLSWTPVTDPNNFFRDYRVYWKTTMMSNYQLIDSIDNINQNSYVSPVPYLSGQYFWYYITTRTLYTESVPSNVLTNYFVGEPEFNNDSNGITISYNSDIHNLIVSGNIKKSLDVSLQLFDCLGITHFKQKINLQPGINQLEIPVNIKSPGVYFYRLNGSNIRNSGKLLIIN